MSTTHPSNKHKGPIVGRLKRIRKEDKRDAAVRAMSMPWYQEGLFMDSDARYWIWRASVAS